MRISGLLRMICIPAISVTTAGCSGPFSSGTGGISKSSNSLTAASTITGVVSAGPINGATLTAYLLNNDGSVGQQLATTTTDGQGNFTLNMMPQPEPIVISATGGSYSEEASGSAVSLGGTQIRTLLPSTVVGQSVGVTPITEIAAQTALAALGSNASTSLAAVISSSNASVSAAMGIGDITKPPADPNRSAQSSTNSEAIRYALALSAISELAQVGSTTANSTFSSLDVMQALAATFTYTGSFSAQVGLGQPVTLVSASGTVINLSSVFAALGGSGADFGSAMQTAVNTYRSSPAAQAGGYDDPSITPGPTFVTSPAPAAGQTVLIPPPLPASVANIQPIVCTAQNSLQFAPACLQWHPIATAPSHENESGEFPPMRSAIFWTGSKILAWGDVLHGSVSAEGDLYDPSSNTWSYITLTGAPAARTDFASAFTGTEMLVWGGRTLSSDPNFIPYGDGAAYNLANNSWAPISIVNAPTTRFASMFVWTGATGNLASQNKLIVYGGQQSFTSNTLTDGAVYDRATDSWASMSTVNAPSIRRGATAVWSGTEMIVWGGGDPWSPGEAWSVASGGIYDPASDSWTSMSATNAPPASRLAGAVWAGTHLYVWGGTNYYSGYLNTGGSYDPSGDSWSQLPLAHAPAGRQSPTLLSTGSFLYVVGGTATTTLPAMDLEDTGAFYGFLDHALPQTPPLNLEPTPAPTPLPWTSQQMPNSCIWNSMTYGAGIFMAVSSTQNGSSAGCGLAAVSTNGVSWTTRALSSTLRWNGIAYGNGRFVAIANTDYANVTAMEYTDIAVSTDGVNWTQTQIQSPQMWGSIIYANGIFVAPARSNLPGGPYPAAQAIAATSTDGINWTQTVLTSSSFNPLATVYGNGLFVIFGDVGTVTSSDGVNWTMHAVPAAGCCSSAAYGNGIFVGLAGANGDEVFASSDGIHWTQHRMPSLQMWSSITFGNGVFVALSFVSNVSAVSADGITWVQKILPVSSGWTSSLYADGIFFSYAGSSTSGQGMTAASGVFP